MRRVLVFFALVALLAVPATAIAAEKLGVYVAPKFVTGWTMMNDINSDWDRDAQPGFNTNIGDKTKAAIGGALAIGYDFNRQHKVPVRAEIEYAIFAENKASNSGRNVGVDDLGDTYDISWSAKQKMQIHTLFANVYYDFYNSTAFTPYVGAGVGVAFIKTKAHITGYNAIDASGTSSSTGSHTTTNFAWNVGAGIAYDINETFALDLGYRFAGLGEAKTKWDRESGDGNVVRMKTKNVYMHQIALGLRMTF